MGLIRFKVETRPDKVLVVTCLTFPVNVHINVLSYCMLQLWVGAGSRAADEKRFFDTHLAPFYRIEQVSHFLSTFLSVTS